MGFSDGIPRANSFSLTDFKDFDSCSFRFFVSHHLGLGKKYEIAVGSFSLALGTLLDESIKLFLATKAQGNISHIVRGALNKIQSIVSKQTGPSFYSSSKDFLDRELLEEAIEIFEKYYKDLNGKMKPSLGEVEFCERIIKDESNFYKIWGSPDTIEMGEDGVPEVCDYKFMDPTEEKKQNLDFELSSSLYMLLCARKLINLGFEKARFCIRFWKKGKDDSLKKDFYLSDVFEFEVIFKKKIKEIINTKEFIFCEKPFCNACKSKEREIFVIELEKRHLLPLQSN